VEVGAARVRALQITSFPRFLEVKALSAEKTTNTGTLDAVHFVMNTYHQASMYFGYFTAAAQIPPDGSNPTAAVAAAFAFALRALAIFEYQENDGTPGFQVSNGVNKDVITGFYNLSHTDLPWRPIDVQRRQITGISGTFNYTTVAMETLDGVFFMKFILTEKPISVDGIRITPDQIKVDFAIRWFTTSHVPSLWTFGPSNATLVPTARVGIVGLSAAAAAVVGAVQNLPGGRDSTLRFAQGAFVGFFAWAKNSTAVIQGIQAGAAVYDYVVDTNNDPSYAAAIIAGWVVRFMWFSFDAVRPSEVYWDPTFGADIDYAALESAGSSLFPCSIALFFAFMLIKYFH
jgi:hypothetical protein